MDGPRGRRALGAGRWRITLPRGPGRFFTLARLGLALPPLAVLVGGNVWLGWSRLAALTGSGAPEYLLFPAPAWVFWSSAAGALGLLAAAARALERRRSGASLPCLAPLGLLALPVGAVALLDTRWAGAAGPWVYLGVDLRRLLYVLVAGLVVAAVTGRLGPVVPGPRRAWLAVARRLTARWKVVALAIVLAVFAAASSPPMRLAATPIGDEPKYLRYLENWYRGRGLDIEGLGPIADLPADEAPRLGRNLGHLASALGTVAGDVADDARRVLGGRSEPRTGAIGLGDWFIRGRHGGVYQVHPPGLSLLLFPGYYLDRRVFNASSDFHPQLPSYLYATSATLVALWVGWGLALHRFLRRVTAGDWLAWALAATAMMSLPAAAFNYQYYPEAAGGLAVMLLAMYLARAPGTTSARSAVWHGLLAGALPWLHIRFGAVSLVAAIAVAVRWRAGRRDAAWWLAGMAAPLAALALYDYYLTGSVWPWAMHMLSPDTPTFSLARIPHDLVGFWIDRDWGLVAHAPVYLLALPGLWLAWRWRRREAWIVAALVLAVAVPAAGHSWKGGATTPLRLVAAVVPLLMLAVSEACERYGRSRAFVGALVLFGALSALNGFDYNRHHYGQVPQLAAPSLSGWKSPLLLPSIDRPDWGRDLPFWLWVGVTLVGLAAPMMGGRPGRRPSRTRSWTAVVATELAAVGLAGTAMGALTGDRVRADYLEEPGPARHVVMGAFLARGMAPARALGGGWVEGRTIVPQGPLARLELSASPADAAPGEPVTLHLRAEDTSRRAAWGRASIECTGGITRPLGWIMDGAETAVTWNTPGTYHCAVDFDAPGDSPRLARVTVEVREAK